MHFAYIKDIVGMVARRIFPSKQQLAGKNRKPSKYTKKIS